MNAGARAPLICHVTHALRVGGLENGLVNLINRMPRERFRHAVISLTEHDPGFARRIERDDVELVSLHKREGKDPMLYWRLWRTLRRLRPDLVHTRNLAAIEAQLPAWLAGVPARVHGEHGRDVSDLDGSNRRYRSLRRLLRPFVQHWIPLSRDLEAYLRDAIGVADARITRITNGVDVERFRPDTAGAAREALLAARGWPGDSVVIGWIGRMEAVKNPLGLVEAFARLREHGGALAGRARLVMIGGGSRYEEVRAAVEERGLDETVWLPGPRDDVPEQLRAFDLFALPSLAEGISNTILEALASGLPVVATDVGGNAELVAAGKCGALVPADDPEALAQSLQAYLEEPERLAAEGRAARARAEDRFSIDAMVSAYTEVYTRLLGGHGSTAGAVQRPRSETTT